MYIFFPMSTYFFSKFPETECFFRFFFSYSSGIDSNRTYQYIDHRRLLESSQSNRLQTDQRIEIERAAWVRLYIFALTLKPMGKTRCLEIEEYASGYAAKAKCRNQTNRLLHSPSSFGIRTHSLWAYCLLRENNQP